ncbi:MAG: gluconate 2-dehydrogenase subunit 3 family protein [Acidobacteriia bacterium]|nr:gluconate 2-dehydrogenase subunit 3 family protein [Terriglobia bacterium]
MKKLTRRTVIASATLVPVAAIRSAAQIPHFAILEAAADRILPPDDLGPGAKQAGAANYIATVVAADQPFLNNLSLIDDESQKRFHKSFVDLAPADQDSVLTHIESTARPFFARLRQLTLEGMFADPSYGGNRQFAGWDLIRYPGPRLAVSPEEQKLRDPIKPVRRSANNAH